MILGTTTSKPCEAAGAQGYTERVFFLTPSASSVAVIEDKDNVFQVCFTDPNQGSASALYIADHKLGTKIAVIYNNADVYSTGIRDTFVERARNWVWKSSAKKPSPMRPPTSPCRSARPRKPALKSSSCPCTTPPLP